MKKIIVVISADFVNAKQIANEIMGKTYRDKENVKVALEMLLEKEEGEKVEAPTLYTIDHFIHAINDDAIGLDGYFVTQLNLEL